ncbi:hypothetical protein Mame01_29500 [Microbispora amethystogenes]|nr:hypothetical protein Mame01_29500 [Microbispora amethystogenes]
MPENDQPEHWTLLARAINKAAKDWPTTFRTSFVIAVTGTAICLATHFAQPSAEPQPPPAATFVCNPRHGGTRDRCSTPCPGDAQQRTSRCAAPLGLSVRSASPSASALMWASTLA